MDGGQNEPEIISDERRARQSGQGMAEYSVVTAVIILTAFLVFQALGAQLSPLVGIVLAALGA